MLAKTKKGGAGTTIIIIILVLLLLGAVFIVFQGGGIQKAVDPCERQFSQCNHACGEGFLNSFCKAECTSNYNKCGGGR